MRSNLIARALLGSLFCVLIFLHGIARADWIDIGVVLATPILPSNGSAPAQNPPGFSWPVRDRSTTGYDLQIQSSTGTQSVSASRNWYLPTKAFAAGDYLWRVRVTGTSTWSDWRSFKVTSTAPKYEVPDNATLTARVLNRPRPRSLPATGADLAQWIAFVKQNRSDDILRLQKEVDRQTVSLAPVQDSEWPLTITNPLTADMAAQQTSVRTRINLLTRQLEASSLLYVLLGDDKYLQEALGRGDQLANLNVNGPTSYENQDQATRQIVFSLARAADLLRDKLGDTRRKSWLSSVESRMAVIYSALALDKNNLEMRPFDSHGSTHLAFMANIASLTLGDIPAASSWFDFSVRFLFHYVYPWSDASGGYANGSAYGEYAADYAVTLWTPLANMTGVSLFDKPWSVGMARFFMYFVPPGAHTHTFGDAAETIPETKLIKAFVSRVHTPEALWYASNLVAKEDALTALAAPSDVNVALLAASSVPAPFGAFPDIGWAAMHSDMVDRGRTSVYFKSSRFGSYNHSHGDQNSFVIVSQGTPLLIDSGWYDWYGSPLWNTWYRQTKAHNAITFDGGQGQVVDGDNATFLAKGQLTRYTSDGNVDQVEGDATQAYGGALSKALRRLWYIRGADVLVVKDTLASATARVFEWNVQAAAALTQRDNGDLYVKGDLAELCITKLSTSPTTFAKRTAPAVRTGYFEDHGYYRNTTAQTSSEFLFLLNVGCKVHNIALSGSVGSRRLTVDQTIIQID